MKKIILLSSLFIFSLFYSENNIKDSIMVKPLTTIPIIKTDPCDAKVEINWETGEVVIISVYYSSDGCGTYREEYNMYGGGPNSGYTCGEYDAFGTWLGPCPSNGGGSGSGLCPPGRNCDDVEAP